MKTHPLIESAEEAIATATHSQARRVHGRIRQIIAKLRRRFGVPIGLRMGMGGWNFSGNALLAVTWEDDAKDTQSLSELGFLAMDLDTDQGGRRSYKFDLLDDEHRELLRELNELCEWLTNTQHAPVFDIPEQP